jgi:hypothetical protein
MNVAQGWRKNTPEYVGYFLELSGNMCYAIELVFGVGNK